MLGLKKGTLSDGSVRAYCHILGFTGNVLTHCSESIQRASWLTTFHFAAIPPWIFKEIVEVGGKLSQNAQFAV